MRFTIKHLIETDADVFWDRIFFDEEFTRALCVDHLRFSVFRVLSFEKRADGVITRRIENAPPVEVPKVVKKVLGDTVKFVEDGRFDPQAKKRHFRVIPAVASDKILTSGELWVEPRGDKRVERFCAIQTQVKIFGIGKIVEDLIEKQTRANYDQAAVFTNRWIREKGM